MASTHDDNIAFALAAYDAMSRGDVAFMEAHTHPEVVFQQGGRFPTAGTFQGRDAMLRHFMEFMAMVEGEFSMDVHDVLASDERVAVYLTVTIGFRGKRLAFDEVHLWKIVDDLLVEMRAVPFDPYTIDAFLVDAAPTS